MDVKTPCAHSVAYGNQQKIAYEQSYTLEHFLQFLAGDVDSAGSACAAITPEMFAVYDNNGNFIEYDEKAYNEALANLTLAKSGSNTNTNGGVMGLIDVAAQISAANGGR